MGKLLPDAIGLIAGEIWGGEKDEEARRLELEALQSIIGGGPKGVAGLVPPELAQLEPERLNGSAFDSVRADPESLRAQRDALANFQRMGRDNGGVEMRAATNAAEVGAGQAARAQTEGALAALRARGMGGSGQALAARLQAGSNAANTQATVGQQGAMDGRRAALSALQSGAGLATNMRGQAFQQDAAKAGANDAVSRFNAANSNDMARFNVGTTQQGFNNRARVAGMANDARLGAADRARDDAERRRRIAHGAASSAGDALQAADEAFLSIAGGGKF